MARTVRLNLLVSPEEKDDIEQRARRAHVTTSELVRRAVVAYEPDEDKDELRALADELALAARRMEGRLDDALVRMAAYDEAMADKDGMRSAARAEIEASGAVWPFAPIPPGDKAPSETS